MISSGYVFILICVASLSMAAQNVGDAEARSKVLALENAWDQAQERRDAKGLSPLFEDSLIFVDYDGKVLTKAEYLARVKANSTHMQQIVAEGMNVELFGATAIVVGSYRVKGVENGKPYSRRGRFTDTWVVKDGNWICIAAATTPILH